MRHARHARVLIRNIKQRIGNPKAGVEIGVCRGATSEQLLRAFPDCHMTFVDPWRCLGGRSTFATHPRTRRMRQRDWDRIFNEAANRIKAAASSCLQYTLLRMTSEEAALHVPDNSFDFVYIDADHAEEFVRQDIELWLPKTRRLIGGHDYGGHLQGVKQAVDSIFGEDIIVDKSLVWLHERRKHAEAHESSD